LSGLEKELPKFALTSTDFGPQFEIKSVFRQLMETLANQKESMQREKNAPEMPEYPGKNR